MTPALAPQVVRVASVVRETRDTNTLTVQSEEPLPRFLPGQFSMLSTFGGREIPISISGNPEQPDRLSYTIRAVGAASAGLTGLHPGAHLALRSPFGTNWPVEAARGGDVLLIAGGIGLAPLRPVIYSILSRRAEFGSFTLLYGARTPQERLFRDELKNWNSLPDARVLSTVDYGGLSWRGPVGVVTGLMRLVPLRPESTAVMMCGPEIMMRFAVSELKARKFDPARIYLSLERNMRCAAGFCGHCQMGPYFLCRDGPVFSYDKIACWVEGRREL